MQIVDVTPQNLLMYKKSNYYSTRLLSTLYKRRMSISRHILNFPLCNFLSHSYADPRLPAHTHP